MNELKPVAWIDCFGYPVLDMHRREHVDRAGEAAAKDHYKRPLYAIPNTHRIVPVEPTDAMIDALFPGTGTHTCRELYKAMLAASQEPKQ